MAYVFYKKKGTTPMRPYIPGEDVSRVSVQETDVLEVGGMIAHNPNKDGDQWYVAKSYFETMYEEA